MINYRSIFNPSYNYIGIILIVIIILLIILNNKNICISLKQIGKISILSGSITCLLSISINFIIDFMISNKYKIFVQIISDNVIKNALIASLSVTSLGTFLLLSSLMFQEKTKKYQKNFL